MQKGRQVIMDKLPKCDFCGSVAKYDARTQRGYWGYMCLACFGEYGIGLGVGKGQELLTKGEQC